MHRTFTASLVLAAMIAIGLSCCDKPEPARESIVQPEPAASGLRRATIASNFPCEATADCTFTKFANTPKDDSECACLAACTPFVINVAEKNRREAANGKFCSGGRRAGEGCPPPP